MMDWTDRHCRTFHRRFSRHALLYTEMVAGAALVHGPAERLLELDAAEHPVALQLGGSEPEVLARAVEIAAPYGYAEINLNVGCPSDRVQAGRFGACLMREPDLVAECLAAMRGATTAEVTVKCRIGVDEQEPEEALPRFLDAVAGAGIRRVIIHARKAWLKGLSPKENRSVPPLDYPLVHRMAAAYPELEIVLNGGLMTLEAAEVERAAGLAGTMIGRAAYHDPAAILGPADRVVFGADVPDVPARSAVLAMLPYIERWRSAGLPLNHITRHMLGAFAGQPGARRWRRTLSDGQHLPGAGPDLVLAALGEVAEAA